MSLIELSYIVNLSIGDGKPEFFERAIVRFTYDEKNASNILPHDASFKDFVEYVRNDKNLNLSDLHERGFIKNRDYYYLCLSNNLDFLIDEHRSFKLIIPAIYANRMDIFIKHCTFGFSEYLLIKLSKAISSDLITDKNSRILGCFISHQIFKKNPESYKKVLLDMINSLSEINKPKTSKFLIEQYINL